MADGGIRTALGILALLLPLLGSAAGCALALKCEFSAGRQFALIAAGFFVMSAVVWLVIRPIIKKMDKEQIFGRE